MNEYEMIGVISNNINDDMNVNNTRILFAKIPSYHITN